jgi:hypothetical protein
MIFRKGFLILLLTLTALLVLTAAFAGDPLFKGALRRYGPSAVGQPLDFQDAGLSILGGSAHIDGLKVGPQAEPLAEVGSFRFDADALALLGGRLAIEEAALGKTHLRLIIDEKGKLGFDPGPPPPGTEPKPGKTPPKEEERTPPEDRDLVQIVEELWERYETYKEYYDEYGGVFGGGEETAEEVKASRSAWPGKPDYLSAGEGQTAEQAGFFWLGKAEVADFSWETLDKRTGKQVLPAIAGGTLRFENLGSPPLGEDGKVTTPPSLMHATADFVDGGKMGLSLSLPRDGGYTNLDMVLTDLPIGSLQNAINDSLPYDLAGGLFDLQSTGLRFREGSLLGEVRLQLRGVELKPKKGSPEVLGVKPAEFCTVLNRALGSQPVEFLFELGGSPTDPSFKLKDATDLDDLILDAVVDEAKARLEAEAAAKKAELEQMAKEEAQKLEDKAKSELGEKADELLGDKAKKGLGGLLGGKKKGGGG